MQPSREKRVGSFVFISDRKEKTMYFNYLDDADMEVSASIKREQERQENKIEMIV